MYTILKNLIKMENKTIFQYSKLELFPNPYKYWVYDLINTYLRTFDGKTPYFLAESTKDISKNFIEKYVKKIPIRFKLNIQPSYLLHKSLKETLQRTHPHYAYQGKDELRLFNFVTLTKKGEVPEGKAKWKMLKDTIYPKLKRMVGAGVHRTRNTFLDTEI